MRRKAVIVVLPGGKAIVPLSDRRPLLPLHNIAPQPTMEAALPICTIQLCPPTTILEGADDNVQDVCGHLDSSQKSRPVKLSLLGTRMGTLYPSVRFGVLG